MAATAAPGVFEMIEANDVVGLNKWRNDHTRAQWNALVADPDPGYPNSGTIAHWAVWYRHWDVVSLFVVRGGDVSIVGVGSWMSNRDVAAYAAKLDVETGHPYYEHVKQFEEVMEKWSIPDLERVPRDWAAYNDEELGYALHDAVADSNVTDVRNAIDTLTPERVASLYIGPEDNPYSNSAPAAHWAVWYMHWDVLRELNSSCAVDADAAGKGGGWVNGRNLREYVEWLQEKTAHDYYEFDKKYTEAMAPPEYDSTVCVICKQPGDQPAPGVCATCYKKASS